MRIVNIVHSHNIDFTKGVKSTMQKIKMDNYITRQQAAEYMKISIRSVDKIISSDKFDGKIKIGNRTLIKKSTLDKYIENCIV